MSAGLFPAVAMISMPALIVGLITLLFVKFRPKNNVLPFSNEVHHEAGHTRRLDIETINAQFYGYLMILLAGPLFLYAVHLSFSYLADYEETLFRVVVSVLLVMAMIVYATLNIVRMTEKRRIKRLALEGEIAVGKMLDPLLRDGGWVFHDVQSGGCKIDHVLVNRAGVFAIDTHTHSKSGIDEKNQTMKVVFDGIRITFPGHSASEPIDKAREQARCLERWIKISTGQTVPVQPVVAIPGWYVDLKGHYDVLVTNPGRPESLAQPLPGSPGLNLNLVNQVADTLDHHCRMRAANEEKIS